ncbi:AraC family transcriptional regulator [Pseudoalteromonas sp. KG3]|uniref:Helix-turn-helix transcriptional regulator n=1 Tax=Pseudoalteromonas prydzensis TaxID=182141 RepID=A0ABR9FGM9_9GAMM|nr:MULTISPECIES: AraC family transcriptional regulator [Pseudoalteromonas]MBE0455895.1 helix-turn-helix transcriptional regulator [Pseudoalteromonas prydzensis]WKD25483.1 AraC family transcriptional regulator [Pseudoalteromonas sp. KG3]
MNTGSKILASLSENAALPSTVSVDDDSIIFMCSSFHAMTGEMITGTYLKIAICLNGGGIVKYGKLSWRWKQGEVLITAPHESGTFSSPDVKMLGIAIDTERFCHFCQPENQIYRSNVVEDEMITSVILALWQCVQNEAKCSKFIHEGVAIILKRIVELSVNTFKTRQELCLSHRQINYLDNYIKKQVKNDIKTEQLADLLGMGIRRFSKALENSTGLTPYKYLLKMKMGEAKQLLSKGFPVTHVAGKMGYSNPSKFSAAFSRMVGCTPTHWKNMQKVHSHKHLSDVHALPVQRIN